MNRLVAIFTVLVFLASSAVAKDLLETDNATVFFCRRPPDKSDKLDASFPTEFSVSIEAVYYTDDSHPRVSDVVQTVGNTKDSTSIVRYEGGVRYQYIFNQTAKTYLFVNGNGTTTCAGYPLPFESSGEIHNDPILFPNNSTDGWWNNVTSVLDVWSWVMNNATGIYKDTDGKQQHEHGVPIDHYYVCKHNGDYAFEVEICMTPSNVKTPTGFSNGSLPVRIDIKRFYNGTKATNFTVDEFVGYRLSAYRRENPQEMPFLPPPGVPCVNVSGQSQPAMPDLPNKFFVDIDYVDHQERRVDIAKLSVDQDAHYVALEYTHNDSSIPLAAHASLPNGKYKIVHDFNYGMQYIVDVASDKCVNVSAIPSDAADASSESGKSLVMVLRNSSEILGVHLEGASFYYVGERYLDDLIPVDVWLSHGEINETLGNKWRIRTVVHEAYFSKGDWKFNSGGSVSTTPTLLALKTYSQDTDESGSPKLTSTQTFSGLKDSKRALPLVFLDVRPCLIVSREDSYLVAVVNDSLENVDKAGRALVENSLRLAISEAAGVSPLRVTNFYFEAINQTLWAFFFVAESSNVTGAHTKWYKDSIPAKDALTNLNKTLSGKLIPVTVPLEDGGVYYTALQQNSLSAVPPFFSTPTIHTVVNGGGYTGGSMAALGICMLLIGGALGMVLAFFLWKRNRASNGASVYFSNKSNA